MLSFFVCINCLIAGITSAILFLILLFVPLSVFLCYPSFLMKDGTHPADVSLEI